MTKKNGLKNERKGIKKTRPWPATTGKSSIESEKKSELLARTAMLFSKEMSEELVELWAGLLAAYSVTECEYAFDNWNRNGHFFPKPAQIIEQIAAYREQNRYQVKRDPQAGKGYGEKDVLILWKLVRERMAENPYPLTEREQAMLLDKLDEITGRTK